MSGNGACGYATGKVIAVPFLWILAAIVAASILRSKRLASKPE